MDPVEALRRVAYLLDRGAASPRRSKAFLHAADVVEALPAAELRSLHQARRLTDLPGVGDSTAEVIAEALDGRVPDRITELEATTEIPVGAGGDLRAAIAGDCHSHSTWSDGGASIETMARAAQALGHRYLVVTDHSPRLSVAHGLTAERLRAQLEEIGELNERLAPFRILTGIEVDILPDGSLDQSDELLAQLDLVVASAHMKLRMERRAMTERLVRAVAHPHVDVLGHCTNRLIRGERGTRGPSTFDAELVFAACARFDTAVEVNCRPERQDPPDDLLELALDWGCALAIDTDAHAPGQLEWVNYGCAKVAAHGAAPERVINSRAADDLLAWAGAAAG